MDRRLYVSVSNQADLVTDLYGSGYGQTERVTKLYGGSNTGTLVSLEGTIRNTGDGNVLAYNEAAFLSKMQSFSPDEYTEVLNAVKTPSYILVRVLGGPYYVVDLYYTDGSHYSPGYGMRASGLAEWGISARALGETTYGDRDYIDLLPRYTGGAKLIHQGFGHLTYT